MGVAMLGGESVLRTMGCTLQHTRLYCKEDSWPDRNAKRNVPEISVCEQTCERLVWACQHFEHVGCTCGGSKGVTEVYRHLYPVNRLHWWVVRACKHWWHKNRAWKCVEPVDIASACVLKVEMAGRWCKTTYRGVRYHQNMAKQELEDMKPTWACWRCERACWRVEQVQERDKWWCWWWMRWWCQPNMGTASCRDSTHAPSPEIARHCNSLPVTPGHLEAMRNCNHWAMISNSYCNAESLQHNTTYVHSMNTYYNTHCNVCCNIILHTYKYLLQHP